MSFSKNANFGWFRVIQFIAKACSGLKAVSRNDIILEMFDYHQNGIFFEIFNFGAKFGFCGKNKNYSLYKNVFSFETGF